MGPQQADVNRLPVEWRRWAALSILRGTPITDVLATLSAQGFPEADAVVFCASLYDNPAADAGRWLAQQLEKVTSVLTVREQLLALADKPLDLDRRADVSREEFLGRYYSRNEPVLLTDVCDRWPARSRWSPAYLAEKIGAAEVEVMSGRESDPNYEINSDKHRFLMPFDEYVAKVESVSRSNDIYLVANNRLLSSAAALPLWSDFELDGRYLRPDPERSSAFLWFGPAGTVTPLHHDAVNVLFNQVDGWKHFILIPALEIHRVYNSVGVYSDVDPLDYDPARHPMFSDVQQIQVDVGPGQSLFIPAGWWHHVEATERSISISFTNFVFPNDFVWHNPDFKL
jgi:hypothetical protein